MLQDVLVAGSATISNNILSGFSSSSYGYIDEALPLSSNTVEIVLDLNITSFNDYDVIMANYNDNYTGGGFVLRTDRSVSGTQLLVWGTNNNTSWTTSQAKTGVSLSTGRNILKIKYNAKSLQLSNSTDRGNTFTDGNIITATFTDFVQPFRFGVSGSNFPATNMSINLANSYIKVNGEYWHSYQRILGTKIIQRHDTAANWTSTNPVLAAGEMGVETDTSRFKFGNGTSTWSELAYATSGSGGSGTQLTSPDGATSYSTLALGDNLVVDTGDIAWTNPAMTSNSQNGYVATASNSAGSNGEAIYRAFDKDTTTNDHCWWSDTKPMPQWIMLECPEPVRVTSCMIKNEVYTPVNLRSGYIQGSNDGSSFVTLYTITGRPNTTGYSETYTFANDKYYKYLRVYCTESHGNGVSIQEIEFKGYVKDPSAVPSLNVNITNAVASKQDKLTAVSPIKIYTDDEQAFGVTAVNSSIVNKTYTSTEDTTKYLESKDKSLNLATYDSWEFRTKLLFNTNTTTREQAIVSSTPFGFNIYANSQLKTYLYAGSTDLSYYSNTVSLSSNTVYYFKIQFTGSKYTTYYSTTGFDSMTSAASKSTTTRVQSATDYMYFMRYFGAAYGATMYLEDTYFIGNGEVVWRAYDESKLGSLVITSDAPEVATASSLGVVQPDGTSITVSETGIISGQDVKTFTGYSDTGTLVLKSINGVLQWVAEG